MGRNEILVPILLTFFPIISEKFRLEPVPSLVNNIQEACRDFWERSIHPFHNWQMHRTAPPAIACFFW